MTNPVPQLFKSLDPKKFRDPDITATGARRASVAFQALQTLWFNTGTLCNLTCVTCYIESSPRNDRLVYLASEEVVQFLDEIAANGWTTEEIGFTGGEPFMNPHMMPMLEAALSRGFRVLVLTNAMRPMMKLTNRLVDLKEGFGQKLVLRVSLDHYTQKLHEMERGPNTWGSALEGLQWLSDNGFTVRVAARTRWGEPEAQMRRGFAHLFAERGLRVNATDPLELVLFPEMDERLDVPEI
ncbi:MAG: radical SAM protein, partial [Gammaproteobacteria bacterium]